MDMRSERLLLNITFDRVYDDEPSQMKSLGMHGCPNSNERLT